MHTRNHHTELAFIENDAKWLGQHNLLINGGAVIVKLSSCRYRGGSQLAAAGYSSAAPEALHAVIVR